SLELTRRREDTKRDGKEPQMDAEGRRWDGLDDGRSSGYLCDLLWFDPLWSSVSPCAPCCFGAGTFVLRDRALRLFRERGRLYFRIAGAALAEGVTVHDLGDEGGEVVAVMGDVLDDPVDVAVIVRLQAAAHGVGEHLLRETVDELVLF